MRVSPLAVLSPILSCLLFAACDPPPNPGGPDDAGQADAQLGPVDCSAFEYRGETYNCEELDRCTEEDFAYRLACCECDPALCNPDPDCVDGPIDDTPAESCMRCHNGSEYNDYAGDGQSNPHPFGIQANIACSTCHGGNPGEDGQNAAHVPRPPQIGNDVNLVEDPVAYFNFLTHTGIDLYGPYEGPDGNTYTGLDYLQFLNPGDLRVVANGEGCGTPGCHAGEHAEWQPNNVLGGATGMYGGLSVAIGTSPIEGQSDLWAYTGASYSQRSLADDDWLGAADLVGSAGRVDQLPQESQSPFSPDGPGDIYDNPVYDAANLDNFVRDADDFPNQPNQVITGSPLDTLIMDALSVTCGDCHLSSRGANNRYGDFRSSGCTSCHMEYSPDGRSRTTDPNVDHFEPADPDAIAAPEDAHPLTHQIRNVAKVLPTGGFVRGISDYACAGCHQGSNRTVMQYWGIRLDQNADVVNEVQYPANPDDFENTANDTRLFDPAIGNNTFNGRNADQYIAYEDYDADGRDDTPADVHHEAGMGCIDCHGERDLHNGTTADGPGSGVGDDSSGRIVGQMSQAVQIQCESCHGTSTARAATAPCTTYAGTDADCAIDARGNPLRHVTEDPSGDYYLISRLDGQRHYVPQTYDVTVQRERVNPITREQIYNPRASVYHGTADGNVNTGIGPLQEDIAPTGFSHMDSVDCATCHSAWQNSCIGCHLRNQYDDNPANFFFSNITGERSVTLQANAEFSYISPVLAFLGCDEDGQVARFAPNQQMFYAWIDRNEETSNVFFPGGRGPYSTGNSPNVNGAGEFGAGHGAPFMAHSIRGQLTDDDEGAMNCQSCHLNVDQIDNFGDDYEAFYAAVEDNDFANLDFNDLQEFIGQNTQNQNNHPYFVHMMAGLGTGLFMFDQDGCPINPLDNNPDRFFCDGDAPAATFAAAVDNGDDPFADVAYRLTRFVEGLSGAENITTGHPALNAAAVATCRQGSIYPGRSGPLGRTLVNRLANPNTGLVLDSWFDANGNAHGNGFAAFLP